MTSYNKSHSFYYLIIFDIKIELKKNLDKYLHVYKQGIGFVDDMEKAESDNTTIGIHKGNTVVKYSDLNDNENFFVSKFQFYLPSEEELKAEIEQDVFELGLVKGDE